MLEVGVPECDATKQSELAGRANELTDRCLVRGPSFLRAGVQPGLLCQQHEGLQEHAKVGPLRRAHLLVEETKDRSWSSEEIEVASELGPAAGLVVSCNTDGCVHVFADLESRRSVRLGETRRVHVIRERFAWPSGEERSERCHGIAVHDIDAPWLDVAARRRSGRRDEQLGDDRVIDGVREERPYRFAGSYSVGHVHANSFTYRFMVVAMHALL